MTDRTHVPDHVAAADPRHRPPGAVRLALLHARAQFVETVRIPIAVIGTTVLPALALLFFVAPQPFSDEPAAATGAASQLAVFAAMSVCLFTFGVGVAEDRALPWDPYVRTLPVGAGPRMAGRLLNGLAFLLLGLVPLVAVAAVFTAATLPPSRLALACGTLLVAALPLLGAGLAIGYSMPSKAALGVAQLLLLPLAFAGGLFLPPELFPGWLDAISTWLPTRAGRDLMIAATVDGTWRVLPVLVLAGWAVVTGSLAAWAYRHDEGRRFT